MRSRALLLPTALLLLLGGGAALAHHGLVRVKAAAARVLIGRALEAHLRDGRPRPPWPWADFRPIAVLEVRRLGIREPILTGVTGASLAFGVGHLDGTPLPGEKPAPAPSGGPGAPPRRPVGQAILAGHRDRAFAFLKDLRPGDRLSLRAARGSAEYVVRDTAVVRHDRFEYPDPTLPGGLVLVTCHPFGGVLRTPWRYVVRAARVGPDRALRPRAPPPPRHAPNGTPRGAPPAPPRSPGPWEDRRPV